MRKDVQHQDQQAQHQAKVPRQPRRHHQRQLRNAQGDGRGIIGHHKAAQAAERHQHNQQRADQIGLRRGLPQDQRADHAQAAAHHGGYARAGLVDQAEDNQHADGGREHADGHLRLRLLHAGQQRQGHALGVKVGQRHKHGRHQQRQQ